MKRLFVAFVFLFVCSVAHAGLYFWVDENGVRHYSNTAPPEDGEVDVNEIREQTSDEPKDSPRSGDRGESAREKKRRMQKKKKWEAEDRELEEIAAAERLKRRRESIADDYLIRAEEVDEEEGYGPEKQAAFLRSIAETCLKCSGRELDKAEEYYELADSKVNEIPRECEAMEKKGSVYFTKVTFGEREWSKKCVNKKIREAKSYKAMGDAYMCPKKGKKKKKRKKKN